MRIRDVFAYRLRVPKALTANAAMPFVAGESVRTPRGPIEKLNWIVGPIWEIEFTGPIGEIEFKLWVPFRGRALDQAGGSRSY